MASSRKKKRGVGRVVLILILVPCPDRSDRRYGRLQSGGPAA